METHEGTARESPLLPFGLRTQNPKLAWQVSYCGLDTMRSVCEVTLYLVHNDTPRFNRSLSRDNSQTCKSSCTVSRTMSHCAKYLVASAVITWKVAPFPNAEHYRLCCHDGLSATRTCKCKVAIITTTTCPRLRVKSNTAKTSVHVALSGGSEEITD